MTAKEVWILASGNRGKLAEFNALLADAELELELQSEHGIEPVEETGTTFIENALQKARHASRQAGRPAIADDSGLVVDALGGRPGVLSARYAGAGASDGDNMAKLLAELEGVAAEHRSAHFYCALAALRSFDDPTPLVTVGQWDGHIAQAPRGQGGFGYDPVFVDPATGLTAAELAAEAKNRVSHRAQALAAVRRAWRPSTRG